MVLDFDVILEDIGDFGRYQKFVVYLLCVPACFMNAFGLAFVFLGYTPDFACVPPNSDSNFDQKNRSDFSSYLNDSALLRACKYKVDDPEDRGLLKNGSYRECTRFVYDKTYFESTIVTQWDLVCDHSIHPKTMMSIHSLVTLFACLINSYFQDLWGRKVGFLIVLTTNLFGGITSVFAPNFLVFAVLRSFMAYSSTSTWNVSYTWALEYVGPTKRTMVTMIMCVLYGVGAVAVAGLAYVCDTWIKMTLAGTVPFLILYTYAFLLDESPRWLLSRGRNKEALATVQKMARWEKKTLSEATMQKILAAKEEKSIIMDEIDQSDQNNEDKEMGIKNKQWSKEQEVLNVGDQKKSRKLFGMKSKKAKSANVGNQRPRVQDLFLTRNLRWKTCLITYCWAANLLTYLAIAFNMENLKGNLFVTYTLQAAVEIPAGFIIIFLLDRYGRIPPLSVAMVTCGVLLFAAVPVDSLGLPSWVIVTLTLLAKFGITLSFGILVQLAGESYPTQLRGMGTGFSSFVGTLGSTVMPYVVHSAKVYKMLPMILMGSTAVTSGLSVLMLPETMGRYMPETVAEAEKGESVGLDALKENWRKMQCCSRNSYKAVQKNESSNATRNGIIDKENEEL